MSQSISTDLILGVISLCLSRILTSILCFLSRFIIEAQTSSLFAQVNSGRGHNRAILASLPSPSAGRLPGNCPGRLPDPEASALLGDAFR